jgi:hypothetical protein
LDVDAFRTCRGGARVELQAKRDLPGDRAPTGNAQRSVGSSFLSVPIFCRRDDYMFLPPEATAGLPCLDIPTNDKFDPYPLAVRMAAELPPPDLRIGMNPAKGMVAVPTWFWVEGYDGGTLSQSQTVLQQHTTCRYVTIRGANGLPQLDENGRPRTRVDCTEQSTTFVVSVRLWPNHFTWDFGDNHGRDITCAGQSDCGDALGQPFVDVSHPSPIQHPYVWSSLGVNGAQDAYHIGLAITFAADYQVVVDGGNQGSRSLPSRTLTWNANHQVQEAQAVLTRPCPVTEDRC